MKNKYNQMISKINLSKKLVIGSKMQLPEIVLKIIKSRAFCVLPQLLLVLHCCSLSERLRLLRC